jgi:ferredoxin-NADP reductase
MGTLGASSVTQAMPDASPLLRDWQLATVAAVRDETPSVRTIAFSLPQWTGHLAGQHVDVRLTADDGYQAERSYSIASPSGRIALIEITVERITDGEVSPFLTERLALGDTIELRGPLGGYFTWRPENRAPLMLIAGGSGIVPLMSMLRTRAKAVDSTPTRLLYSSRNFAEIIYRDELDSLVAINDGFSIARTLTRGAPANWHGETRRVDGEMLAKYTLPAAETPDNFVCGPTSFVETVADQLVALGHRETAIKTERFGPTGEKR